MANLLPHKTLGRGLGMIVPMTGGMRNIYGAATLVWESGLYEVWRREP
jgi:hypothetical protein